MSYVVRTETSLPRPLAVVRRRVSQSQLASFVPHACGVVWKAVKARQLKGGRHVSVYLNGLIDAEVGVELDAPFEGEEGEVIPSTLPAGTVATTTHFGPYGGLGQANRAIVDYCAKHGHTLAGPSWEIYGHWVEAWNDNPSLIRTDVYYLLK